MASLSHISRPLARLPRLGAPARDLAPAAPRVTIGPQLSWRARLAHLALIGALTGVVVAIWSTERDTTETMTVPLTRILAPAPEAPGVPTLDVGFTLGDTVGKPIVPEALPRPPEPADPIQPIRFERFTVAPGDTLFDISTVYGVSIDDLLRFNRELGDGTRIDIGQVVRIPVFDE